MGHQFRFRGHNISRSGPRIEEILKIFRETKKRIIQAGDSKLVNAFTQVESEIRKAGDTGIGGFVFIAVMIGAGIFPVTPFHTISMVVGGSVLAVFLIPRLVFRKIRHKKIRSGKGEQIQADLDE